jgi:hypothetical protein
MRLALFCFEFIFQGGSCVFVKVWTQTTVLSFVLPCIAGWQVCATVPSC